MNARALRLRLDVLVLAGCCAFFFFFGLNSIGLVGADEPRYAQIAREMLARHDYVTPVLHGLPWLEKPVLYYWEAMLAYRLLGVTDWAARLPAALNMSALILGVYWFMRRWVWASTEANAARANAGTGVPLDAALILASSAFVIAFGHAASTDAPLAATFSLGMLAWMLWRLEDRRIWLLAFYVLMALGTLAKGPVAPLLAALILVVFAPLRRQLGIVRRTLWWPGILAFLVVAAPWYVLVQQRTGNFFQVFLWSHNVERFTTPVFRHSRPFWYYLPVWLAGLTPWTVLAIAALVWAIRHSRTVLAVAASASPESKRPSRFSPADLNLLLVLWGVLPVLFFSLSGSKLPGYILPAAPPFAMLLALWLAHKQAAGEPISVRLLLGHALAAGATLTIALISPYLALRLHPPGSTVAIAVFAGLAICIAVLLAVRRLGPKALRVATLLPVILGLGFLLRVAAPALDRQLSARPMAADVLRLQPQSGPVGIFGVDREMQYGLSFYLNRQMARYEDNDVPPGNHLLICQSLPAGVSAAANRRLALLGRSADRAFYYFWVSEQK